MRDRSFIKQPNLPTGPVRLCAVSGLHPAVCEALRGRGIEVIEVQPHLPLPPPVAHHPDMLLHHLGGREVMVARQADRLAEALGQQGFAVTLTPQALGAAYPDDCALNCARIGSRLLAKTGSLAAPLLDFCRQQEVHMVEVAQGYSKCSVCIVDETAIITADPSIASAAAEQGIEVLQISPGGILLKGYPYGFIGGCCGLIDRRVLAFAGEVSTHPEGAAILRFLVARGVEAVALTDGPLQDIGSIIPLKQEPETSLAHIMG